MISIRITKRQFETLELVLQGMTNAEIAEELKIRPRTAESHVSELLSRFEVKSRTQLVAGFMNNTFFYHVENLKNYAKRY